jgi:hypothetical protein
MFCHTTRRTTSVVVESCSSSGGGTVWRFVDTLGADGPVEEISLRFGGAPSSPANQTLSEPVRFSLLDLHAQAAVREAMREGISNSLLEQTQGLGFNESEVGEVLRNSLLEDMLQWMDSRFDGEEALIRLPAQS